MMTGMGTSHVVTAPTAGGRFAYALLWCVPAAYIFKYYGFEMAFRFTNATGKSLIEAYSTAWKKWPLWYLLAVTLLQCAIGQAGRLIATSAVVYYAFAEILKWRVPMEVHALVLGLISVAIIWRGNYQALETFSRVLAGVLVVSTGIVYFLKPAPLSSLEYLFFISTPEGSWPIIAAFLGLLPTGIDVSLQASEWGKAKRAGLPGIRDRLEAAGLARSYDPFAPRREDLGIRISALPDHVREYCERWFRIELWDFRIGHIVSFGIAVVFLILAAVWLYPSRLEGPAVMGEIATIFTKSVGSWSMVLFLLGAFAALYATAFGYFDGWPRVFAACCRNMFRGTARLQGTSRHDVGAEHRRTWYSEYNIYRGTMIFSLVAAVAVIAGVREPVFLVLVASTQAFFIAPVIFFLNIYYCLKVIPKESKVFYPSKFDIWFSWTSCILFTAFTIIGMLAAVFKIRLIG
jgi:Mn2+/Fe2+ NRAMP family transporter